MNIYLTPKQLDVLAYIRDTRLSKGYSPTFQEMSDKLGINKVTAFGHVQSLLRKGILIRDPRKSRSLTIKRGIEIPAGDINNSPSATPPQLLDSYRAILYAFGVLTDSESLKIKRRISKMDKKRSDL